MKRLALLLSFLILLTGCWDRRDIESRGYVLGIAVDKYPPLPINPNEVGSPTESSDEEEKKLELIELYEPPPIYSITIQLPVLKKAELTTISTGGGGGEQSKTWEITEAGNSFVGVSRDISTRNSLILYYEHLQVIIISEDVARDGIENIMDFFLRDPEMRRRVKVFICKEQAKKILDVRPRVEDYSALYLAKLPLNATRTSKMVHLSDLGEIINRMHAGFDFLLPTVEASKDEIKTSGAAVFSGRKMVGWIDGLDVEAIKFMVGTYLGGVVTARNPADDSIVVLEVTKSKSRITPVITGDMPAFKIDIKVEGDYSEDVYTHSHGKIDSRYLEKLDDYFARQIEKRCMIAFEKLQRYNADVMVLKRVLETKEPEYWEKISHRWDVIYPNISVVVNVDVDINLQGIVK